MTNLQIYMYIGVPFMCVIQLASIAVTAYFLRKTVRQSKRDSGAGLQPATHL